MNYPISPQEFRDSRSHDDHDITRALEARYRFISAQLSNERFGHGGAYISTATVLEEMDRRIGITHFVNGFGRAGEEVTA